MPAREAGSSVSSGGHRPQLCHLCTSSTTSTDIPASSGPSEIIDVRQVTCSADERRELLKQLTPGAEPRLQIIISEGPDRGGMSVEVVENVQRWQSCGGCPPEEIDDPDPLAGMHFLASMRR